MKEYNIKYIGKEYETNEGYMALVVGGGSKSKLCTIKIGNWVKEVSIYSLKSGSIKNPYHPRVFGVGYIGDGIYRATINNKDTKSYIIWHSMMQRCYSPKYQIKKPTYVGCSVEKSWLDYQNFAKWFSDSYIYGFALDKDLLTNGNKIYSEEACIFIPRELNKFLANEYTNNTSGSTGVAFRKDNKKWRARINDVDTYKLINIGQYDCIEKASEAYRQARLVMVSKWKLKLVNEYGITDLRILDAIDKL